MTKISFEELQQIFRTPRFDGPGRKGMRLEPQKDVEGALEVPSNPKLTKLRIGPLEMALAFGGKKPTEEQLSQIEQISLQQERKEWKQWGNQRRFFERIMNKARRRHSVASRLSSKS